MIFDNQGLINKAEATTYTVHLNYWHCISMLIEWNPLALLVKASPLHHPSVASPCQDTVSVVSPLQYQWGAIIETGMILKTVVKPS